MILQMSSGRNSISTSMQIIFRHRSGRCITHLRFVHIVPNPIYALRHKVFIKSAPPLANFRICEIRPCHFPRPCITVIFFSIGSFYPNIICCSRIIDRITSFSFSSRINHPYRMEPTQMQVSIYSFWIRKTLRVKCEYTITIHIINVHPNCITRNTLVTKRIGYFYYTTVRRIRKTALLIA